MGFHKTPTFSLFKAGEEINITFSEALFSQFILPSYQLVTKQQVSQISKSMFVLDHKSDFLILMGNYRSIEAFFLPKDRSAR